MLNNKETNENFNYDTSEPSSSIVNPIIIGITFSLIFIFIASVYLYKSEIKKHTEKKLINVETFEQRELKMYELDYLLSWERKSGSTKVKIPLSKAKELVIKSYNN